jgi:hypothetical protein
MIQIWIKKQVKNKKMKHIKLKLTLLLLCAMLSVTAQQKLNKLSKTINVTKDVTIDLNTSYVQIEIDTWNKNTVEIEAYIESEKLSKEDLKKALDDWNIKVDGSGNLVTIASTGNRGSWDNYNFDFNFDALKDLELQLSEMPAMPELPEMPELPQMNFPKMPKMPALPELPEGMKEVNFDYEAYKKNGEKYLDKWSADYQSKYGKDYKDKMRVWAQKFGEIDFEAYEKNMEAWGEEFGNKFGKDYEKKMEAWSKKFDEKWGKEYEKKMEAWGEKFGKEMEDKAKAMESRSKELEKRMEERQERVETRREDLEKSIENRTGKVKKTIKIKMPKDAKLKMNVRHGELKISSVIKNLKADISHATLVANHIDGSETSINVSYSPVLITTWSLGELKLNFVDKAQIKNVDNIVLKANSSNIGIDNLAGNASINGSFGDLSLNNIAESFKHLKVVLENSDALIHLPKGDYKLQYKGNRSRFSHPKKKPNENLASFSSGNVNSSKTIVVDAKFSHVVMQ